MNKILDVINKYFVLLIKLYTDWLEIMIWHGIHHVHGLVRKVPGYCTRANFSNTCGMHSRHAGAGKAACTPVKCKICTSLKLSSVTLQAVMLSLTNPLFLHFFVFTYCLILGNPQGIEKLSIYKNKSVTKSLTPWNFWLLMNIIILWI